MIFITHTNLHCCCSLSNTDCMQCWSGRNLTQFNTQFLATQFDAVGQKCICFSRRICHRRKIVFVQKARSLFVLDSFTHHITCGLVARRTAFYLFMDGKISNLFSTSFYCPASYNGNYGCLSHHRINVTFCYNVSVD